MASTEDETSEWDIIIIGAGTAGCVLANRLSEDPNISVVLLEAGEDHNNDERVYCPGLLDKLLSEGDCDWKYLSEPQPGINGRTMKHPRGKALGGSSAINSIALIYPSTAGMDAWADLGNEGWAWKDMKPYFRKFQTVCAPGEEVKEELGLKPDEGTNGPIQASFPLRVSPLQKAWIETFRNLGLENQNEPLDGAALGGHISTCHLSGGRRERSHAGIAYYEPVRARSNLHLITGASVQKILFDRPVDQDALAKGVAFFKGGINRRIKARKEVVLAAGAFASPQILELSGIGDAERLQQHGIAAIYNNPNVGENLQDHIRPGLAYEPADGVQVQDPMPASEARKLYEDSRTGPWAERGCFTFAYMPLTPFLSSSEKQELSDLLDRHLNDRSLPAFQQRRNAFIKEMILSPSEATATAFMARKPGSLNPEDRNWINLCTMLSHPFSRGSVHIASSDVAAKPTIDFGYYSHPLDLEVHARHIQILDKIISTAPLSTLVKKDGARRPHNEGTLTLENAKELMKEYSTTNYHPCGTCSMMPENMGGVVDDKLRVYGTQNVRVVDASIMPIIPRGNIITTVYAAAEKAADIISEQLSIKRTT